MSEPLPEDTPLPPPPADVPAVVPPAPILPQKLAKGWVLEPIREKEPEPEISLEGGRAIRNRPRVNYADLSSPRVTSPVASASTKKRATSTPRKTPPKTVPADALQVSELAQTFASLQSQIDLLGGQVQSEVGGPPKKKPRTTPAKSATEQKTGVRPVRSTAGKKAPPAAPTIRGRGQTLSPVMKQCSRILQKMLRHRHAHPFAQPVDPVLLMIPDYFDIVKNPMDFGTINQRLESNYYSEPQEFADDVRLVFSNCRLYNAAQSDIVKMGNLIETETFEPEWAKMPKFQADLASKASNLELTQQLSQLTGAMLAVQQQMANLAAQGAAMHLPSTAAESPRPVASRPPSTGGAARRRAPPAMNFEEKRWLSDQITMLEHEPLVTVVQIIHESHPFAQNADGTAPDIIEIDIDSLDANALRKLMVYVKKVTGNQPPSRRKPATPAKRASPSTSPLPVSPPSSLTTEPISEIAVSTSDPTSQPLGDSTTTAAAIDTSETPSSNVSTFTPSPAPVDPAAPVEDDDDASYSSETDSSTSDDDDDDQSFGM